MPTNPKSRSHFDAVRVVVWADDGQEAVDGDRTVVGDRSRADQNVQCHPGDAARRPESPFQTENLKR